MNAENYSGDLELSSWFIRPRESAKDTVYLGLLDHWMGLMENGVSISSYLIDRGIESIAIYGFGIFGKHMLSDAMDNNLLLKYIIDKNPEALLGEPTIKKYQLDVISPNDIFPDVDVVVVASPYFYEEIYENIKHKTKAEVISIQYIIRELCEI